jgi:hypothetical protein
MKCIRINAAIVEKVLLDSDFLFHPCMLLYVNKMVGLLLTFINILYAI